MSLHSPNLAKFPPTVLLTCSKDCMRDDSVVLEAALKDAGVPVWSKQYKGMPHYFHIFVQLPKSRAFLSDICEGIRWALKEGKARL